MDNLTLSYLTIGAIFLVGLLIDNIGQYLRLPRVTLLLMVGFISGPSILDLLPDLGEVWFEAVTEIALMMIGFLLGGHLTLSTLRRHGRRVLMTSVSVVLATAAMVSLGTWLAGASLTLALILGAVATATAPAATEDVIREARAKGPFSETLLGIVAIDDAWGLILFSLLLAFASALNGGDPAHFLAHGLWEVGGALLLGLVLGVPMAYLTGRVHAGEPTLVEALGFVLLCGGIALYLEVSYILAAMAMGVVVVNMARHHDRPFHAIEGIEWPFKLMFFLLAGASLELHALMVVGSIGLVYIITRIAGRVLGAALGTYGADRDTISGRWMGLALLPQAGIAIGMALTASKSLPGIAEVLMPIVISTTVLFELTGPILTRLALKRAGEIQS